ncbi:EpsG family protein [Photobacterium sanguinicancri]|uniref:EpsG family protein n=1 Tax=Photobacterium sanguinicancri TaxID=875932 RepID=UPI0026E189EE|nr:EpsG family protein [Photobacterium sanguinicancri]MDO6499531.1 EpsG family protein [Photobacterium sanguinicancri]
MLLLASHQLQVNNQHDNYKDSSLQSVPFYMACFLLFVFSSFRKDVGADFDNYYNIFIDFRMGLAPFDFEPLNMLIINVVNYLGLDVYLIFPIYAAITLFSVYYFLCKLSKSKELSLAIFFLTGIFYLSTLNGIRQWAAVALVLVAIVKMIERKTAATLVCVLLAALFHKSAIIMAIIPFLSVRLRPSSMIVITILSFVFVKLVLYIISISGYNRYLIDGLYTQTVSPLLLILYSSFLLIAPVFLGYFSKNVQLSRRLIILINLNFISILILFFGFMSGMSAVSIMRMNMYFQMQVVILLPELFLRVKPISARMLSGFLFLILLTFYFFNTLFSNGYLYKLTPYSTFLG